MFVSSSGSPTNEKNESPNSNVIDWDPVDMPFQVDASGAKIANTLP